MEKIKVLDLFCGAGGFSLGFKHAGFEVQGIDNWNVAYEAYTRNVGYCRYGDIYDFTGQSGSFDIIIGSPPCQSFSGANIKSRSCDMSLTKQFMRIVNEIHPKIWCMENVPEVFGFIETPYKYIFNMSNFGLLQSRNRCFASNIPLELKKTDYKYLDEMQLKKLLEFRPEAIHRPYQTIHGRYNSFDKTSPKIKDKQGVRLLDHAEALQIQSFPFYYVLPNSNQRKIEQLIGNAVPPLFAYKIAKYIKEVLNGEN